MKLRGRNYFLDALAIVFHLAVAVGIFHASWTYVPSVSAPNENLVGSMEPIQPVAVRTIAIGKAGPPLPSGPGLMNDEPGPGIELVPPIGHRRWPVIRKVQ